VSKIYIPSSSADDWKGFLKDPEKHWKIGYSARALAHCWTDADGLPGEIADLLATSDEPALQKVEPLLIIPELITPVAGKGEPPHSDVFVLGKASDKALVSITIEGKVKESFGNNHSVATWKQKGNIENRAQRLSFLLEKLALSETKADDVVYQLVQRTASAVVEAGRFNAKYAVMIVQSFSLKDSHYEQFEKFVNAFNKSPKIGELVEISTYNDIRIFVGWARGNEKYLNQ